MTFSIALRCYSEVSDKSKIVRQRIQSETYGQKPGHMTKSLLPYCKLKYCKLQHFMIQNINRFLKFLFEFMYRKHNEEFI